MPRHVIAAAGLASARRRRPWP